MHVAKFELSHKQKRTEFTVDCADSLMEQSLRKVTIEIIYLISNVVKG